MLFRSVQASFYKLLTSGRILSFPTVGIYQMLQPVPVGTSFTLTSVRAFSRLSQVYITFKTANGPNSTEFYRPAPLGGTNNGVATTHPDAALQARLFIGPKCYPMPSPTLSTAELFKQFQAGLATVPNVTRQDFEQGRAFSICWDLKKIKSDITSAINTRSGEQVMIKIDNMRSGDVDQAWLTMLSFNAICVRESGVVMLT